jgi:hypothetical protein
MEESLSEDSIQEMLEELEEEQQSGQEPLSPDVENLLRELESGRYSYTRSKAAEQLGRVDTGSPRIVQALLAACETDAHSLVREAAAKALSAPVHQEWLQNHPRLLQVAEGILQREAEVAEFALRRRKAERCDRKKPTNSNLVVVSISGGIILLGIGIAGLSGIISWFSPALVFVLILAGVVLVACALWTWLAPSSARNVFLRSMKETEGTVEDLREEGHYESGYAYYVTVRFRADDANMGTRVMVLKARVFVII